MKTLLQAALIGTLSVIIVPLLDYIVSVFVDAPGTGYVCDEEALSPIWDEKWIDEAFEKALNT